MLGERGNGGHGRPRAALTEQFGYDTKYAMHMCRLAFQGVELMETGRMELPIPGPIGQWLRDVRNGRVGQQEVLTITGELEVRLRDLITDSPVQEHPDEAAVEAWMTRLYFRHWSATRSMQDAHEDAVGLLAP